MVVLSMLMSWRDSVRRGHWRPLVWTLTNGESTCSHIQVPNSDFTSETPVNIFDVELQLFLCHQFILYNLPFQFPPILSLFAFRFAR